MIFKAKKKNINNKYKSIIYFLKNLFALIFSIQILIFILLLFWYFNNPIKNIHSPEKILNILSQKSKNLVGFDLKNVDKYLKIYFLSSYYSIFVPEIDKIDLNINQKNYLELEFQRQNREESVGTDLELKNRLNKFVNGTLVFNEKKLPIKLRVKGDRRIHYDKVLSTSYKIDLRKGNKIWGLEEFSLQKPIVRNYVYEYIYQKLHHELGNISLNYKLVNLSINGLNYGIYSIEEGFSKELLEKYAKRDGPIYGTRDDVSITYPNVIYDSYSEINWVANNQDLLRSGYAILNLIKENDENLVNYIDWDAWGKFFAVTDMVEAYHGALAKSVRIYYNPISGKIEPISFDGHHGTADFSNFIILDFLKQNSLCSWICDEKDWFLRFLVNKNNEPRKEFLEPYLKYLKKISSKSFLVEFENKYSSEISKLNKLFYSDFSKYDNIFWRGIFPYVYDQNYLSNRAKQIKNKLGSTNLSNFIFSKKDDLLSIKFAQESVPIKLISNCENIEINKNQIWVQSSKTIFWPKNCKLIKIETINEKFKEIYLFDNPVLNSNLPVDFKKLPPIYDFVEGNIINNNFIPSDNEIIITQSLKLPKNLNLLLKNNQKITLKNSSSLVLLGNLNIKGSKNKQVIIEGIGPYYGSLISFNNIFEAENLIVKNLTSPKVNGYLYYGGVNIINAIVTLKNVTFKDSLSEDTLNLIESNSMISNLKFINSKSDALDIDSGSSNINYVFCENIGNDCLDFSNSEVVVNNIFTNNIFDKSISVGESSKVNITNVEINNSEIGIAVKDNSEVKINSFYIKNSTLPIAVFVKKNEFGPAKLIVKNMQIENSNEIFLVDDRSYLEIDGKKYIGKELGGVIESYLYGNLYGRTTVR